jgi:hypothetical protein
MKKLLLLTLALVITSCTSDKFDCFSGRVLSIDIVSTVTTQGAELVTLRVQVEDICSLHVKTVTIRTLNGVTPNGQGVNVGEIIQY